jgi:hypothetical protein
MICICIFFYLKTYFAFRCRISDGPTNFDNCVRGEKVENYGTPYDFNSIMHYGLYA